MDRRAFLGSVMITGVAGCVGQTDTNSKVDTQTSGVTRTKSPTPEITSTPTQTPNPTPTETATPGPTVNPVDTRVKVSKLREAKLTFWIYTPSVRVIDQGELVEVEAVRDVFFQPQFNVFNLSEQEMEFPPPDHLKVANQWTQYEPINKLSYEYEFEKIRKGDEKEIQEPFNLYESIDPGNPAMYSPIYDIKLPDKPKQNIVVKYTNENGTYRFGLTE